MKHRGLAVVERCETAIDRGCKLVRFADALAMRAEGLGNACEIPPLALTA